ncbi:MAG: asparagine synthase (glutamine-hydrolyzing) [Candidatus Aureabacteria bacterium]|nr:asparagine synthase (glutamine-hydrolyzing) [Candidatus Auribacterota bacterium]
MCGICGFKTKEDLSNSEDLIRSMVAQMTHRGPDESGFYAEKGLSMGMRRLSIIDISGGTQPVISHDGSLVVFQNGEIYNYIELREELEEKHRFKTHSDTEVILHLYEEHGEDCVQKLNGMFAIAIYDKKKKKLLLFRDRYGIKPLYYYHDSNTFIYSSELRPILLYENIRKKLDFIAVDSYLRYQYVPHPLTMFEHIKRVRAGYMVVCDDKNEMSEKKYYDIPAKRKAVLSLQEHAEQVRREMENSVRLRLRSDVPVGVFLSGGIDSTIITALACRLMSKKVKTFSIGYKGVGPMFNEIPYCRKTAEYYQTDHNEIIVTPDHKEIIYKAVEHLEEPCGDSSSILTYIISKETARYVKVALSGTGGDELFGGYSRYLGIKLSRYYALIPRWIRKKIIEAFLKNARVNRTGYVKNFIRSVRKVHTSSDLPWLERYLRYMSLFQEESKNSFYLESLKEEIVKCRNERLNDTQYHRDPDLPGQLDDLNKLMFYDIKTYLPDDLLFLTDKMSMANSLEIRVPFMDHHMVEAAVHIPSPFKIHGWQKKFILQKAFQDIIPKEVFKRKKIGFMAPVDKWLKEDLRGFVDELLSPDAIRKRGFFDEKSIRNMIEYHRSEKEDYSQQIFSLIMLELWFRRFME